MRIQKFQTAQMRLGPLEGEMLYRVLIVGTVVLLSIFFFNLFGLLTVVLFPVFLLKFQSDYLDEIVVKKIRGITVPGVVAMNAPGRVIYEVFGINYGFSEVQDEEILETWSSVVNTFSEDMLILRIPYRIPLETFKKGRSDYDSLFSGEDAIADAYFIIVEAPKSEEFESVLSNHGIPFLKLRDEEGETVAGIL